MVIEMSKEMRFIGLEENYYVFDVLVNYLKRSGGVREVKGLVKDMVFKGVILDCINYIFLIDLFFKGGEEEVVLVWVEEM